MKLQKSIVMTADKGSGTGDMRKLVEAILHLNHVSEASLVSASS